MQSIFFLAVRWRTRRFAGLGLLLAACALGAGSTCFAAETIEFGVDANEKPITWTMVPPDDPPHASMQVDEDGRLHLKFLSAPWVHGKTDVVTLEANDADCFGANAQQSPWFEYSWIDDNLHGLLPNIDLIAEDTRPDKLSNQVLAGSLFRWSVIGYARIIPQAGEVKEEPVGAAVGRTENKPHTARVGKLPDGTLWFVLDGKPTPSVFLKQALGSDHSAWSRLRLEIHNGEVNEEFIIPSLKLGAEFKSPAAATTAAASAADKLRASAARRRQTPVEESPWGLAVGGACLVGLVWLTVMLWRRR